MSPILLLLGLALSAPPQEAEAELLEAARTAKTRGDAAMVTRALRGWATLRKQRSLPVDLNAEAADAVSWAETAGQLRVYGSRLPDRVRVGVDDPARIVGRLDCFIRRPDGQRARLIRAESESAGRNEYLVPPDDPDVEIVVEAILTELGRADVVLRRTSLVAKSGGVPDAPDPKKAAAKLGYEDQPQVEIKEPDAAVSWWWVAVGVVAAGLAGAAVWQETR